MSDGHRHRLAGLRHRPPRRWARSEAALQLGLIGVVQFVPLFALTLITGWTADRVDRRCIARASIALEIALRARSSAGCPAPATITLPALFVVAALLGVARAFAGPALQALAPNLVPREVLAEGDRAELDGLAVGRDRRPGGRRLSLRLGAAHALCGERRPVRAVALLHVHDRPDRRASAIEGSSNPWRQMIDGLHYVRRNRLVLGAISLDLFAVLLGGATAMLPVFARDILHAGPTGLGHLRAAPAVGATLTAIWFACRPLKHNVGVKMLAAVGVFGVATIAFGFSRWHAAVARLPRPARRGRHALGLRPPVADPALHARRDARPGRRRLDAVHLRLERAGRGGIGLPGRPDRAGRRRGGGRQSARSR